MKSFPFFVKSLGCLAFLSLAGLDAGEPDSRSRILGEAILDESAHAFLEHISDEFGHRMVGTPGHAATMDYLEEELQKLGLETARQTFTYPGWVRGSSRVELLEPQRRVVRAVDMAYVGSFPAVTGELAYVEAKEIADLDTGAIKDRILLVRQNTTFLLPDMETLHREHGVKGLLYINRVNGGQLLARTSNHDGLPAPFPVLSISQEEGLLMQRLLEDGKRVRVELETTAELKPFTGTNLIAMIPGRTNERVLLGAHFDSWDLGQGAIDNGLGVAQLYAVAKLLKAHSPANLHSIELVWFDAEELGLWGSRHYAESGNLADLRVVVNLDMVGRPVAVNAMGFDGLVPQLEAYVESLGAWELPKKVENKPWLGSDHHPFVMQGVPAVTFNAPIDADDVRYYHDFGDTLDKVDRKMLGEATALIALLVHDLANREERVPQLDAAGTEKLLRDAGLEERLRRAGKWPFGDGEAPSGTD